MNSVILINIRRFIVLLLVQVLFLKQFAPNLGSFQYMEIILYPLFLILLPIRTPHSILVLLGFVLGLSVDIFYDSPGVHAAASVFTAFIRPLIIRLTQSRDSYNLNQSPTMRNFGRNNFLIYAAVMLLIHLFTYFSVEAFTFVYIKQILLRTFSSFVFSLILLIMYMFVFNPKE